MLMLIVVIISWASIRFLIWPQLNKSKVLEEEKLELETTISQINSLINKEDSIEKELASLKARESKIIKNFFSSLNQHTIINLLDEILKDEGFLPEDMIFYEPREEGYKNISLMRMDVDIPYTGDYNGVLRVIRGISSYPKEIMINSVTMDTVDDKITGNISLSFYILNQLDDFKEGRNNIIELTGEIIKDPFNPFDEYTEEVLAEEIHESIVEEEIDVEEIYITELLEDFEEGLFEFIPSNVYVKGNVSKSKISKDQGTSLRLEYFIMAIEDENRASINLDSKDILIKYPPYSFGMWVYSYGYSPMILGIKLKTQNNEEVDIKIREGISWIGWNYVETDLPLDISLYPLKLDKIYIELTNYRDDVGVLLFDKLEVNYPKESNKLGLFFRYHIVREGETLEDISLKYYGTTSKKALIKEYNEIKSDNINAGRILVIPK